MKESAAGTSGFKTCDVHAAAVSSKFWVQGVSVDRRLGLDFWTLGLVGLRVEGPWGFWEAWDLRL